MSNGGEGEPLKAVCALYVQIGYCAVGL